MREPDAASRGTSSLEQRMVALLRDSIGSMVSGAELASRLNVSRTAVWKLIHRLRAKGYSIEAIPSRGYCLHELPDVFTPGDLTSGLTTRRIGHIVQCITETDSTNTRAYRWAEAGAAEGSLIVAERQTAGKGRLGRRWESPSGVNLYCSVILRPTIPPAKASQLTFLSAVAVARTIETVTGLAPQIKWPNDILLNGRKVAGLLNEMSAETDGVHFIIVGIGLNINMRLDQFPDDLRYPATSLLLATGAPVARVAVARTLFTHLDQLYEEYLSQGFNHIRQEWVRRSAFQNRMVRVAVGDGYVEGVATGIADDGALLLDRGQGQTERIISGDVTAL